MKKVSILICIFWMAFIFYNSSQNGIVSNARSLSIIESAKTQFDNTEKQSISTPKNKRDERLNLIVRKNAHAFEYIILAILLSNAFFIHNFKGKNALINILFLCMFYAVTDEFHQSFVPGRTSLVSDVLIDFLGSIIGAVLYIILKKST